MGARWLGKRSSNSNSTHTTGTQEVLLEEALPSLAAAVDGSTAASESGPSAAPSFLGTRADAGHAQPPTWEALRAAGAGFWLRDPGLVLDVGEKLAKAQFAAARKPDACALLYVALGKKATLQVRHLCVGCGSLSQPHAMQLCFSSPF